MCWRITKLRENAAPQWKIPIFSSKSEVAYENSPKMGMNSPFPHQHHDFPKTRENSPNLAALITSHWSQTGPPAEGLQPSFSRHEDHRMLALQASECVVVIGCVAVASWSTDMAVRAKQELVYNPWGQGREGFAVRPWGFHRLSCS